MRLLITLQVLSSVIAAFAAPIHVQTIDDTFVTLPPNPMIKLPAPGFAFKLYMSVYELKPDELGLISLASETESAESSLELRM
ncbi:uncharacterized protein EAF02_003827 [Botrytis sinoallii]|uniref:uncharacterized protein n=1 Tax=Botrytis sinoallii TaxID=1463999 RepID=UPI0018FF9A7D|nr:uncharacterized protein EAF02_003827 [Botrytis sinoallii]KAF7887180.1 hypothetical protein EAF02_003827 [Botrytis sinoallii]